MSKQSSIDWLIDKVTDMIHESHHAELVEHMQKAREMHRQEMETTYYDGMVKPNVANYCYDWAKRDGAKRYYNEKFGGSDEN